MKSSASLSSLSLSLILLLSLNNAGSLARPVVHDAISSSAAISSPIIAARTPEDKRSPLAPAADDIVRRAGTLPVFTNPPTDGTEDADEKLRRAGTLPVFTNPPTPGTEEDDVALPFFTNPQPLDDTDKKLRRRDIGLPVFTNPQPGDGE